MTDRPAVGFVGIGNMGWPMAACLSRAGFDLRVADARRVQAENFVQQIGGWDETFPTSGDFEFGLRLAVATRVALVAEPMIKLIETMGSLSKKVNTGNRLRVLEKFTKEQPALAERYAPIIRRSRAEILRSYAEDCIWFGRYDEAATQLRASLRTQFNWGALWLTAKLAVIRATGRKPGSSRAS